MFDLIINKLLGNKKEYVSPGGIYFGRYINGYKTTEIDNLWDEARVFFENKQYLDGYEKFLIT